VASGGIERLETPIIEDEQRDAAERSQDASVTAVAARESEIGEELGNALVENGAVITAGFVTERRCKPAFPNADRVAQDQILVGIDPVARDELLEQRTIEPTCGAR
jgi:hypothetical protein